ncbi:hypothetical protein RGR602_PB00085 (plasmid) [Rhizobium gallicum bv. gallicum R602sp]|uniref:Uncharacterized protein n=1 Tax=Rhizobium gallicum bv. gallicum R602sp TaxID=1041138 RepID=A0A0B4XA55_9HYPH|nr:hypothetical protein RGR602_PB00085 [Rhizobium gallicum bv. gallicum R602sp]
MLFAPVHGGGLSLRWNSTLCAPMSPNSLSSFCIQFSDSGILGQHILLDRIHQKSRPWRRGGYALAAHSESIGVDIQKAILDVPLVVEEAVFDECHDRAPTMLLKSHTNSPV